MLVLVSGDLGHQVTARYDATTLAVTDAVEFPQHENSLVGASTRRRHPPVNCTRW
jgi:hypothetical protein